MTTIDNIRFATSSDAKSRELLTLVGKAVLASKHHSPICANVNDYAPGDPAEDKLRQAVMTHTHVMAFTHTYVTPYDTLSASYNGLTQILAPEEHLPAGMFAYLNVAPIEASDVRNGSHPFLGVLLSNGRIVFSPNSGHSLSLLAPFAKVIFEMPCATKGEQFRSWQCFPREIGRVLRLDFTNAIRVWGPSDDHPIPPAPDTKFACPDNFGNVKTLYKVADAAELGLKDGDIVEIIVDGSVTAEAVYGKNVRKLKGPRLLSLAAGSGLIQAHREAPIETFLDLFRLRDKALELIGNPSCEQKFEVRRKPEQTLDIALFDRHDVVHRTSASAV